MVSDFVSNLKLLQLIVIPTLDNFDNATERILTEAFRIDQHGFTPTELERAKETILASYERAYNERDKSESKDFARELCSYFEKTESAPGIEVEYALVQE
jgi:zinc protease